MKSIRYLALSTLGLLTTQALALGVDTISAEALDAQAVRVTWSVSGDPAYYELYQDSVRIQTGIAETSYTVSGLQADTRYKFFVTACESNGMCSKASAQSSATTDKVAISSNVCDDSSGRQLPMVELGAVNDGMAVLSWCEVLGAEGYNVFLNGQYQSSFDAATFETSVSYSGSEQYQVAWYSKDYYPAKSAVAIAEEIDPTPPNTPETEQEELARLDAASNDNINDVEIYFTRHAEKETQLAEQEDGSFIEVCGESKCAEILNAKGELRAELLAQTFQDAGITGRLTHAFSSHKYRTAQTIAQIASEAGLGGDIDKNPDDGIQEFPVLSNDTDNEFASELNPESTSPSVEPVISALLNLPAGSVALVAAHSGTLYDIMSGIGLSDVCVEGNQASCTRARYPVDEDLKVKNFGDIWKATLEDGEANFVYRVNLQPNILTIEAFAQ